MNDFNLKLIEERQMTAQTDQAIRDLLCICFPPDVEIFSKLRPWNNVLPEYSLIYEKDGRLLGHVGVVYREISCNGLPAAVAGIQSMAVHPDLRGTGLGQAIMKECMAEASRRGVRFGLLFCNERLSKSFYNRLGWVRIDEEITMSDENGHTIDLSEKNIAMYLPLAAEPLPSGPIDLQGREW